MNRFFRLVFVVILIVSVQGWATEDDSVSLTVQVEGIRNQKGEVGIGLFRSKKGFPTHLEFAYELAWMPLKNIKNQAAHLFEGLPAGEYAVSALHDEEANRLVDRGPTGFPKEGFGLSNDQKIEYSPPPFDKCKFSLSPRESKKIVIKLEYREK